MSHDPTIPLVTVLVDTWNHERFIDKALQSVLDQDFDMTKVEIIVIDDGSTDSTPAKIAAYGERVRYVRKENGGQASAFNMGIPLARGEIVAMLDGDDWWHPRKLSAVVEALEKHPEAIAVGHGLIIATEEGEKLQQPPEDVVFDLRNPTGATAYAKRASFFGTSRLTARTAALRQLLPVPEALIVEADEWFFTLLPSIAPVVLLREALTYYRLHGGNLFQFSSFDDRRVKLKKQVMCCLADVLPGKMAELGVPADCIDLALSHTRLDARRLKLAVDGGLPGAALLPELAAWRMDQNWSLRRLPSKLAMIVMALLLPSRTFYRLRHAYAARNS